MSIRVSNYLNNRDNHIPNHMGQYALPSASKTTSNNLPVTGSDDSSSEVRRMARALESDQPGYKTDYKGRKVFTSESKDKVNGYLQAGGANKTKTEEKPKKKLIYNYKDVSTDIRRAKTSGSANMAVLKARRQVLELKRKLASGDEDREEVMAALSHAKAVERVAKKKKHNLELEEMVENAHKSDRNSEDEGASEDAYDAASYELSDMAQDKLTDAISEIDDQQLAEMDEIFTEVEAEYGELPNPDDLLASIDEFMAEFGGEEQEMMSDLMDQFAALEVADPNMSEEDLKELKQKHRAREEKDLIKADMDYLKKLFEYFNKEKAAAAAAVSASGGAFSGAAFSQGFGQNSSNPMLAFSTYSPDAMISDAPEPQPAALSLSI